VGTYQGGGEKKKGILLSLELSPKEEGHDTHINKKFFVLANVCTLNSC